MQKVSEILQRGVFGEIIENEKPVQTIAHDCDYCGKNHQTEMSAPIKFNGEQYPESLYCEACNEMLKATGEYAEFNRCHRCRKSYIVEDRRYWSETKQFCADCAPVVVAELAAAERQRRVEAFNQICPPLYRSTDTARLPAQQYKQVMAWQYGATGLLLHGETGKGKTRCAWLLLQRLHVEEYRQIVAFDAVSFSHDITKNFGPDGDSEKWLKRMNGATVLFLDDLGKCRLTERGEAELFGIIENRMANLRPIIATTNFVGATLAGGLRPDIGTALVRRLRESCEAIAF